DDDRPGKRAVAERHAGVADRVGDGEAAYAGRTGDDAPGNVLSGNRIAAAVDQVHHHRRSRGGADQARLRVAADDRESRRIDVFGEGDGCARMVQAGRRAQYRAERRTHVGDGSAGLAVRSGPGPGWADPSFLPSLTRSPGAGPLVGALCKSPEILSRPGTSTFSVNCTVAAGSSARVAVTITGPGPGPTSVTDTDATPKPLVV